MRKIKVIIPIYNEEETLPFLEGKLITVMEELKQYGMEVLFVNDGSRDRSLEIIEEIRKRDKRFSVLSLSRNFGKEIAIMAGFDYAKEADAVILMDADLQDPPELIPKLIYHWEQGYDDVYAKRKSREGETFLKKITSKAYYRVLQHFTSVAIQKDTGDFRLLDGRCVRAICQMREEGRCSKSIFSWIGYHKKEVLFERGKRVAGKTKWNYRKLIDLSIDGITSLSISPLRWATYFSIILMGLFLFYLGYLLWNGIVLKEEIESTQCILLMILFLGMMQTLFLGILRRICR